jgi:hypothetical protein
MSFSYSNVPSLRPDVAGLATYPSAGLNGQIHSLAGVFFKTLRRRQYVLLSKISWSSRCGGGGEYSGKIHGISVPLGHGS